MIKRLLILFVSLLISIECYNQAVAPEELIREMISQYGQVRLRIPYPGKIEFLEVSRNLSVSSVTNDSAEIVLSPVTMDWFIGRGFKYSIIKNVDNKNVTTSQHVKNAMEWDSYPSYTQYDSIMQSFSGKYPSLCNLDTIGTSINGRLVLALKISDNAGSDENEPETFYSSTIHGDETGGFILMLRFADYLLSNYNFSSRVKNLIDNLEIWINPLANPDGTYRTGNTIISPSRFNANGYDLNRNFPDPVTPNTPKQKETLDMIGFMREHNFVLSANFHSGKEVVNYPWDRWPTLHADNEWFYAISRSYADTVHKYSIPGYMTFLQNGVTNGYDWYLINGGRQDFVTWELQGREVTIELDNQYVTPVDQLNPLWNYNRNSLLGYLENALYGIHGTVTDAGSGEPLMASVFITGHDKDSSHVYSNRLTGRYIRLISPGTWDIVFSARGYADAIVENVIVIEGQTTVLDVEMLSYPNPVDTIDTESLVLYPVPADVFINILLPERLKGPINISVFNMMGMKLKSYNEYATSDDPINVNVSDLAGGLYSLRITNTATGAAGRSTLIVINR